MSRRRQRNKRNAEPQTGYHRRRCRTRVRGIAHVNGKTVFVFGALAGESVRMQVVKSNRKYDQATTLEVLEASPATHRAALCRLSRFAVDAACNISHNEDQVELKLKQALR